MPLIRAEDLGADVEDRAAKEGRYDLRILKSEYKTTKSGNDHMLAVLIGIDGEDGVMPFSHYLTEPKESDEQRIKRMRIRDLKRFLTMFGVPFDQGFDMEEQAGDLVGCTASNAMVTVEEYDGGTTNRLKLPRID